MANLLPILIVGGASAAVVSAKKTKRSEKRSCPHTNKVTLGPLPQV